MMFKRFQKFFLSGCLRFMPLMAFIKTNRLLISLMGHQISKTARIWSSIEFLGTLHLTVGEDTFIGHRCSFAGNDCQIKIGNYCDISSNVSLFPVLIKSTYQDYIWLVKVFRKILQSGAGFGLVMEPFF